MASVEAVVAIALKCRRRGLPWHACFRAPLGHFVRHGLVTVVLVTPEAISETAQNNNLPVNSITAVSVLDPYFYRG